MSNRVVFFPNHSHIFTNLTYTKTSEHKQGEQTQNSIKPTKITSIPLQKQAMIGIKIKNILSRSPDVFREAVLDELLVLELIKPHEDGVVASIWSGLEVEHHIAFDSRKRTEQIEYRVSPSLSRTCLSSLRVLDNEETVTTRENIKKRENTCKENAKPLTPFFFFLSSY